MTETTEYATIESKGKNMEKQTSEEPYISTTFQLPKSLHLQLKTMCLLTEKKMGEFIRIAIRDKISDLKNSQNKG